MQMQLFCQSFKPSLPQKIPLLLLFFETSSYARRISIGIGCKPKAQPFEGVAHWHYANAKRYYLLLQLFYDFCLERYDFLCARVVANINFSQIICSRQHVHGDYDPPKGSQQQAPQVFVFSGDLHVDFRFFCCWFHRLLKKAQLSIFRISKGTQLVPTCQRPPKPKI
jgi:hypothetical protein